VGGLENMTKIIKSLLEPGLIITLLLVGANVPSAIAETLDLDLSSAIEISLQNNESYLIAEKELDRASGQIMEAVSGALPQITGGLVYNRNWRVPTGVFQMGDEVVTFKFGTEHNYTADLTLTQPLYSGGRTFTALSMAKTYKKMARDMVVQSRQDLKVSVFNSFYGAILAQEILRVNRESYGLAEENLEVVQKMYDQGMVAEYDLLRARVAVSNLEPELIKAENDAEVAMGNLKNLLGIDLDTEINLSADFDSSQFILPPPDPDEAKLELQENRPEIKVMRRQTELNEKLVSIAKAGYRPSLTFSTSLQYQAQFNDGSVFDKRWDRSLNSMLVLAVPIFDSWRTPSRVKQARVDAVQSRLSEKSLIKNMILDFDQSLGKYNEARKRLASQGDAVELARRGLSIARVRYENGVGTQLEVSDARLSLARAEINRAVAFHDLAVSYAALLRAMGREIEPAM
jgi:outer membrane protein TolC